MFGNSVFISIELLNCNCDFRILLIVKIFKTVEKKASCVEGIFSEEHSQSECFTPAANKFQMVYKWQKVQS